MKLSQFGHKFGDKSGIMELMDDLSMALTENPEMLFLGGGNPGRIPELEPVFREYLARLLVDEEKTHSLFGIYQSPQGDRDFRQQVAGLLSRELGWRVSEHNIALSNGSQPAFFILFNLLAGKMPDGSARRIHLPLAPEYIGYKDIGLEEGFFSATRPEIELLDKRQFKYRVDFDRLNITDDIAALCVSRPTNPTGNVLTDGEMEHLDAMARNRGIPLIIDGAYGLPFPGIVFEDARPLWNDNTIVVLSLSKLGLPGARTGIIVAGEEIIQAYTNANAIVSLACCNLGPLMAREMFASGEILRLSQKYVAPFYRQKVQQAVVWIEEAMAGLPYRVHKPEGAIFLWLWFEHLPITSEELYQRLKARGVLVIPSHNFFPGIDDSWRHKDECIRVSYAQPEAVVKEGIRLIAEEVAAAYEAG